MSTIRDDSLHRYWVEISGSNEEVAASLRSSLISFLAFDRNRLPTLAGTGFVLAGSANFALVLTAKHVLSEGVLLGQRPEFPYAPSALFVPRGLKTPSLNPEKLKAVWLGDVTGLTLNVVHCHYLDNLDVALCVVAPQEGDDKHFQPISVPLDTSVPKIGETIYMISLEEMRVAEVCEPNGSDGAGQELQLTRSTSIRAGVVTGIHLNGFRQYRWPCFTTSIPAKPGMSGGLVAFFRPGQPIAACGIVCADNSTDASHLDVMQSGESVVACAWTALGLSAPDHIPSTADTPSKTIYEKMVAEEIDVAVGGLEGFELQRSDSDLCLRRL